MAFADLKNDFVNQARELAEAKWEEGHKSGLAEGLVEGHKSGLAEGRGDSLRRILELRGLTLTEEEQERISRCADLGLLDQWLKHALTASAAAEVFA